MYFFSDKKLARDLHKGIVTEKEQMLYLLVGSLLTVLGFIMLKYAALQESVYGHADSFFMVFFISVIIIFTYKTNNLGDGRDYLSRYICLNAPIALKATIFGFILGILGAFGDLMFFIFAENPELLQSSNNTPDDGAFDDLIQSKMLNFKIGPFTLLSTIIVNMYVLWRMISSFKIACGQKEYK